MNFEELYPGVNLENDKIEFKGILLKGEGKSGQEMEMTWLKTIAVFANGEGGSIFVGVEDKSHKIVALSQEEADKQALLIQKEIKQRIEPAVNYTIKPISIKGTETRYLLEIKVSASMSKPVFVHDRGAAVVFVRDFSSSRLATPEEIRDLVLSSENISYDSFFTDSVYKKEDFSIFQNAMIKATEKEASQKQLISIGFCDSALRLSKGALLFRDDCISPLTRIDVTFYPSINKGERIMLTPASFCGPISKVIDEATAYIMSHSNTVWMKTDTGREERPSFPERSVREAISNALAHRNYYMSTSIIEVDVYVDRLEVTSPGSLLGSKRIVKETNITAIVPRRRNEVIARTLEAIHYVENKGSGFDLIAEEYYASSFEHKPFINADQNHFTLVLPNLNYAKGVIDEENDAPTVYVNDVTLTERDLKILSLCYVNKKLASEIASGLGITSSTYFRNSILGKLIKKEYLLVDSSGAYPHYLSNHSLVKLVPSDF